MKNTMNNPYYSSNFNAAQTQARETTLIQRVSYLLCTALLVTAGAAWYADSIHLGPGWFFPLMIGTLVCVFVMSFARTKPAIGLVLLYALSVMEGLLMGPLLGTIARNFTLGSAIIGEAAGLSAIIVAGVGTYVWISNKDFGYLGKFLFWAVLGLLVVGLLSIFVHIGAGGHLLYPSSARRCSSASRCTISPTSSTASGRTIMSWRPSACIWIS